MSNQVTTAEGASPAGSGESGALRDLALRGMRAVAAPMRRLSFSQQFMLFGLVVLVVGAFVIGRWVSQEIEQGVVDRTAGVTALYVDSFMSPNLQELEDSQTISPAYFSRLDSLLTESELGQEIVSFKVWSLDGRVLYARDRSLVGSQFPLEDDLQGAIQGRVVAAMSNLDAEENASERAIADRLLETYAPVRSHNNNDVIGVMEFYMSPDQLEEDVADSQMKGWLIVGTSTIVMYLLLVGMVNGASSTITRQNRNLRDLLERNAELGERVRMAAASKAETDEQVMMRIGHELHDGPAQDLGLALLRLDDLRQACDACAAVTKPPQDFEAIRDAMDRALHELRDIASGLRLPELQALSVERVVVRAIDEHKRKSGASVHFSSAIEKLPADVDTAHKIALYRVTKEALHNAWKHSGVNEASVSLTADAGWLRLEISDPGAGFDPGRVDTRTSLGLRGMRERIELLAGQLSVESHSKTGTVVTARVPYTQRAN
ncbi:MAG: sensor histidine kinase [Chloroflexi bacterium]|nr:sensor histidine kinase [Chloroflexota bacterium]